MIQNIIAYSVKNKLIVAIAVIALIAGGIYNMFKLPLDAVPDITNNQVQIVTSSSSLAPQEVEQFITFPIENAMANIPRVDDIRSISRFGLSVVTVIFEEDVPILEARQFVKEQIDKAITEIPDGMGKPEMMPITTGLGEIYQYVLQVDPQFNDRYSPTELRSIQDWLVKRQLAGIEGIIEISSFGGYIKQYEVAVNPLQMENRGVTTEEVFQALATNNQNIGGAYIEKGNNAYYIRTEGLVTNLNDIGAIVIKNNQGLPILIRDVATVGFGHPPRYGAMTMDGKGEAVGGITLMLKGANSSEAIENVHERIERIQKVLPEGISIYPYLDRSVLVGKAIHTVTKNLIEGGLIVIFVLVLFLGNFRAGLIVASVIPLSLLFAFILMNYFGVSANLMSLGAIDFGIVIDGSVIIVEGILHLIHKNYSGELIARDKMDGVIINTSGKMIGSAAFGVLIIVSVFVPIATLSGIEGKMFSPMALTISFAIIGALLLSITYVPMMSALVLKRDIKEHVTFSDKIVAKIQKAYKPTLEKVLRIPKTVIMASGILLIGTILLFGRLGAEFIPTLDEGDLAMQATIAPGSSLTRMVETTSEAERILKAKFPEVKHVVSKIGTAEVPTDPMAVEDADIMIILKEKDEWTTADNREDLINAMKQELAIIDWAQFDFTQPIELRFNELISGSKNDLAIKVFGDDLNLLSAYGNKIAALVKPIKGAGDVKVEQTEGLPQLMIRFNRQKIALYGLNIATLNDVIRAAFAGHTVGTVYEGQRRFDLTVCLNPNFRKDVNLNQLYIQNAKGNLIPISSVATVTMEDGPMMISRENAQRRIAVGVNVRNRDIAGFVEEVQQTLNKQLKLDAGYYIEYGGQFENLTAAKKRLSIAIPLVLGFIFFLLYLAFKSFKYALMIFITVPLSTVGGVVALWLRDMPFSISAGVGFIALFGVAVLNGIVLLSYFKQLNEAKKQSLYEVIMEGSLTRLRPVLMTAIVASLGFLPMALATTAGAEVQRPLATVVIGGLISATLLTLLVLPLIYSLVMKNNKPKVKLNGLMIPLLLFPFAGYNQQEVSLTTAIDSAKQHSIALKLIHHEQDLSVLDKRSAYSLGNLNANYQYGQMNSVFKDQYFEVRQELGNVFAMKAAAKSVEEYQQILSLEEVRIEKEIRLTIQLLYTQIVSLEKQLAHLKVAVNEFDTLILQLEKKVNVGDKSQVDLSYSRLEFTSLLEQATGVRRNLHALKNQFEIQTGIKGEYFFTDEIPISTFSLAELTGDSTQLINVQIEEAKLQWMEQNQRLSKVQLAPNLDVGYFNQTLDHITGFQGLQIGMSIPLLNRATQLEVKKATIHQMQQADQIEYVKRDQTISWENEMEHFYLLDERHNNYQNNWLKEAQLLQHASEIAYTNGSIDFYDYVLAHRQVITIQLQAIKAEEERLMALFQLEFYH